MLKDIVEVRPLGGYRLYLRFEDGVAGELDFAGRLRFEGIFATVLASSLRDGFKRLLALRQHYVGAPEQCRPRWAMRAYGTPHPLGTA